MVKNLVCFVFVFADTDVGDRFLMKSRDGLGYSSNLGTDKHSQFQSHGVVGYFHLRMFDRELDFGSDEIGVLVDGDLVDRWVVLFLFLFSLLLLFLRSHSPPKYIL